MSVIARTFGSMKWLETWFEFFDRPPVDRTSREVSVQEVLAELIAGRPCDWFLPYTPTEDGRVFLEGLWRELLGDDHGRPEWFVSEYRLPVPMDWRQDISFTYRCPDFAFGDDDHVLVVELKTERPSYDAQQILDYLRLARHRLPTARIDVALLGPHRPGATPPHDSRQRYAETTWATIPALLQEAFPGNDLAARLGTFLQADLAAAALASVPPELPGFQTIAESQALPGPARPEQTRDAYAAAVAHALRTAPSVALAQPRDGTERGIDVAFESENAAREAQALINVALEQAGYSDRVGVWLWRPSSMGLPTTEAGRRTGMELRLQPKTASK